MNRRTAYASFNPGAPGVPIREETEAVDHALLDRLIQRVGLPAYTGRDAAPVDELLRQFGDDRLLERFVPAAIVGSWGHAYSGRPETAEHWFRTAEQAADRYGGKLADGSASVASWVAVLRAGLCPDGPEVMRADCEHALADLAPASMWRRQAHYLLGCASRLLSDDASAEREWSLALGMAESAWADRLTAELLGQLALLALDHADVSAARELLAAAQASSTGPFGRSAAHALPMAALARLSLIEGDRERARRWLLRAQGLRPLLTWALPWLAVQVRLDLARVAVALLDELACRTLLVEIKEVESHRPALGVLVDGTTRLAKQVDALKSATWNWAASLTPAELHVLPLLATYLTLEEIGERLLLSRHTVKSHATAIYRKLGAASRSEAVEQALGLGLLDQSVLLPQPKTPRNPLPAQTAD